MLLMHGSMDTNCLGLIMIGEQTISLKYKDLIHKYFSTESIVLIIVKVTEQAVK